MDGSWTTTDSIGIVRDYPRTVFYNVAFPDKRVRQVKIGFFYAAPFYGLNTSLSDTISAAQAPIGKRVIIFGDSWTGSTIVEPASGPYQPGLTGSGYGQVLGEYFNWDWWQDGVGGTGFVNPGNDGVPWPQRVLTDVCGRSPDRVIVFGGVNDGSYSEGQIQSAAVEFLDELHACLPATNVYMLGPQQPDPNPRAAMGAAAALYPDTVTYSAAPQYWIYGNSKDPSAGNAYLYLNGHPTPLGHDYLAEQVAEAVLAIDPSLALQNFPLFAPVPAAGVFAYSAAENSLVPAGQRQVSISFTPQDNDHYSTATQTVVLTVTQASSTLALSSSVFSLQPGSPLTLTAKVSPQIGGTPSGTVVFSDKGQALGSGLLNSAGVAVFTTSSLPGGQHSISVSYSGDQNFLGSSAGSSLSIAVEPTMITSMAPNSGAAGSQVQISGTGFGATQGTSTITFNEASATPISWSDTSILVRVPQWTSSGRVAVTVEGEVSNAVNFTVLATPAITSLSPAPAPIGATITIAGMHFGALQPSDRVNFNGASATIASWSDTSIAVQVPQGATTGNVSVYTSGVSSNGILFTVQPPDFSFALSPIQVSVARAASQPVLVNANSIAGLTAMLNLTCSGLPANASCSLENEQQVALPADGVSAELIIQAYAPNKKTAALDGFGGLPMPVSCAGILFFALAARKRRIRSELFFLLCLFVFTWSATTGCGTDFAFKLPAQGNYAVAVTLTNAADPSMSHTEMLNVTIR